MKLTDLVITDAILPELRSTDRNGVIRELVEALADKGIFDPRSTSAVIDSAIARENKGSTGFGKGVAVPHAKHESIHRMAATIGRSSQGVDFAALDRAPVYTIVLLLSPSQDPESHLSAMEKIFRHLRRPNFRRYLRQADTKEAMIELIQEADEIEDE